MFAAGLHDCSRLCTGVRFCIPRTRVDFDAVHVAIGAFAGVATDVAIGVVVGVALAVPAVIGLFACVRAVVMY